MSPKRSQTLRVGLEKLEGLEVRITPAAHQHAAAAAQIVDIQSSGTAVISASSPIVNGQLVTTLLSGNSKVLGAYTAEIDVIYPRNLRHGNGTGALLAANGDGIAFNADSTLKPGPHQHGHMVLTITGGTGEFANVTGKVTLIGNVNFLDPFKYTLSGAVKT